MQATAERAMGGGFRRNSDSELKLKNRCTGSTLFWVFFAKRGNTKSQGIGCTYMFESLVEKSKLRPPAKRDMNASPFFALPEPCLGTVLFSFIKSKKERRQMTDTVMNSCRYFRKTLILPFAHK